MFHELSQSPSLAKQAGHPVVHCCLCWPREGHILRASKLFDANGRVLNIKRATSKHAGAIAFVLLSSFAMPRTPLASKQAVLPDAVI